MAGQIPNRIKELREARGWSVRDLAQHTGMDFNMVHRLETGAARLDVDRMRRISQAFGMKASALLPNEDVEFRADQDGMALINELQDIPTVERPEVLHMTRELVRITRIMAARQSAAALGGDPRQLGQLADIWNQFDDRRRGQAIDLLRIANLDRP